VGVGEVGKVQVPYLEAELVLDGVALLLGEPVRPQVPAVQQGRRRVVPELVEGSPELAGRRGLVGVAAEGALGLGADVAQFLDSPVSVVQRWNGSDGPAGSAAGLRSSKRDRPDHFSLEGLAGDAGWFPSGEQPASRCGDGWQPGEDEEEI
jgi:hypothetical protein